MKDGTVRVDGAWDLSCKGRDLEEETPGEEISVSFIDSRVLIELSSKLVSASAWLARACKDPYDIGRCDRPKYIRRGNLILNK